MLVGEAVSRRVVASIVAARPRRPERLASHSVTNPVDAHVRSFFSGHPVSVRTLPRGPMAARQDFHVLEVAPGPRIGLWSWVSSGASAGRPAGAAAVEFVLCAARPTERAVELVTMTAWYHATRSLGHGHTLPIGEPWLDGSSCTCLLVSQPYPFGPEFEFDAPRLVRVLWLLPVTAAERDFKVHNGLDALEERFDRAGIEYWNPARSSAVEASG